MNAFIFDFDGLIIDTETPEVEVWSAIFREHGCEFPESWWMNAIGRGAEQVVTHPEDLLEEQLGYPLDRPTFKAARHERMMRVIDAQPILPGVVELIEEAKAEGVRVAIASSSHHAWVDRHLERVGLWDRFDEVVCADDAPRGKPFPDLYQEAMRRLGASPLETVALEDSANGLRAAKAAGAFAVAVPNSVSKLLDLRHADARLDTLAGVTVAQLRELSQTSGVIESERLFLIPWHPDDAEQAYPIYRLPEVMRYLGRPPMTSVEEARQRLTAALEGFRAQGRGYGYWKLVRKADDYVVGTALVKRLDADSVEVGWHLRPDAWGNGYATEAGRACIEHAFRVLNLDRIIAVAFPENEPSLKVMRRLGMTALGRTTRYYDLELELYELRNPNYA
jgi:HAD superfamily hydrolase (TIGR01509 family)